MLSALAGALLAANAVTATSFEYYRGAFCDAQSSDFFIERYESPLALKNDKLCHQTPAGTMAMKLKDGLPEGCVVLAYNDYGCGSLVGAVPASRKCVAATKAKIGSWQASCNGTEDDTVAATIQTFVPGELKRRGKNRLPKIRDEVNVTSTYSLDHVATASSIVSEISSNIAVSATGDAAAAVTSAPSAGAALSIAISSGEGVDYSLTSYVTDTVASASATAVPSNETHSRPTMTTTTSPTISSAGNGTKNGTVTFHKGSAASMQSGNAGMTAFVGVVIGLMFVMCM